jgi:hypothetical protein
LKLDSRIVAPFPVAEPVDRLKIENSTEEEEEEEEEERRQ